MKTRNEQPEASVSSGSIDLEALRALVDQWRKRAREHGGIYARGIYDVTDELIAVLASLGERRGTQEETKKEAPYMWRIGDVFTDGTSRWAVDSVHGEKAVLRSCGSSWATTIALTFSEWREGGRWYLEATESPSCSFRRWRLPAPPQEPSRPEITSEQILKLVCGRCGHYWETHCDGRCSGWMAGGVAFTTVTCPCTDFVPRPAPPQEQP